MASDIENIVKSSFKRVKEHIEALEAEIKANREFIIEQNKQIEAQNRQILALQTAKAQSDNPKKGDFGPKFGKVVQNKVFPQNLLLENSFSNGNKGVQSINHSTINQSLNNQSINIQAFQEDLPRVVSRISRQEFLTFLMIYQLEDQLGKVTYSDISKGLNLTSSCVRSYVSNLIKKGLPVVKTRYNNKITILSIPPEIRGLNLKKRIIELFYKLDPSQKKLGEDF